MAVKILVDSASDISKVEAEKMGITMIPMVITFDTEEYYDGIDLLPVQFYEKLVQCKTLPKTAQINAFRFEEAFSELTRDGDEVIAIVLSSKLSATCDSAKQAAEKFKEKVYVVDSLSAATGERLLCEYALSLIKEGKTAKEVFVELEEAKNRLSIMAVLDTLEYLKKGGRISSTIAFVGGLLNLKPVVRVLDGEVKMAGKARGQRKGAEVLNEIVASAGGVDTSMPYAVLWTGLDNSVAEKYALDNEHFFGGDKNVRSFIIGSTIGTHVGPGVFGLAFFHK